MKKVIVILATVGLAVAFTATIASAGAVQDAMQNGGNRLAALQNNDGGWDWPLNDGNAASASPTNTIGPIAMGLAKAYALTGDAGQLSALQKAGQFLLAKTNTFSPSDGYLAAELDSVFGGTAYRDHLNTYFYNPLAAGTYDRKGLGTLYNATSLVNLIRAGRSGDGANMAAWDVGIGIVGAAACGADTGAWVLGTEAEINELDGNNYYDVIGLAGALYGMAYVGQEFDPTAGQHAAASSLADLAATLAGYQLSTGGFTWNSGNVSDGNETNQETAYAVLALNQVNHSGYMTDLLAARNYLVGAQLATGGWQGYVGDPYGENNELTGEALWAISVVPEPATLSLLAIGALAIMRRRRG